MLDYAVAVETFDQEVGTLLQVLADSGLADNTLVIVTSDHGMPFPRSKGHNYDISTHVPMVAYWPKGLAKPGRRAAEFVSFIDLAPTFLELLGVDGAKSGMAAITGVPFTDLLRGKPERERRFVITGRERNDVYARPGTETGLGYPIRAIREGSLLYIHNFTTDRWPCGNPELGLLDTDPGPTKKLLEQRGEKDRYWQLSFGKRPADELFDLAKDPDCLNNLASDAAHRERLASLREKLFAQLKLQNDPRILGKGDIFDNYPTTKAKN
jgi:arylsulfatase A-like enzyme